MEKNIDVIVLMGVSGAGKTTIAQKLAQELGWEYMDADTFHSSWSKMKMRDGIALSDFDRAQWLEKIRTKLQNCGKKKLVLACSALKEKHRDVLYSPGMLYVYLDVSKETLRQRLEARENHFASPTLLEGQLQTLEVPDESKAIHMDGENDPDVIVQTICLYVS